MAFQSSNQVTTLLLPDFLFIFPPDLSWVADVEGWHGKSFEVTAKLGLDVRYWILWIWERCLSNWSLIRDRRQIYYKFLCKIRATIFCWYVVNCECIKTQYRLTPHALGFPFLYCCKMCKYIWEIADPPCTKANIYAIEQWKVQANVRFRTPNLKPLVTMFMRGLFYICKRKGCLSCRVFPCFPSYLIDVNGVSRFQDIYWLQQKLWRQFHYLYWPIFCFLIFYRK